MWGSLLVMTKSRPNDNDAQATGRRADDVDAHEPDALQQGPSQKQATRLLIGIAVGALLGGVFGWLLPGAAVHVFVLGDLWLKCLQLLVIPLVVTSMIHGVTSLGDVRRLGGMGGLTIGYYLLTSSLAMVLGIVLVNLIEPGTGVDISGAKAPEGVAAAQETAGWQDVISGLINPNLVQAAAELDLLTLILFSLAFAAVLTTVGKAGKPVIALSNGVLACIMKLVHLVMLAAPIGVFGLVAARFGKAGGGEGVVSMLTGLGYFSATVCIGLAIHMFLTLGLLLWLVGGRNPITYLRDVGAAVMSGFATASSSATLPLTMDGVKSHGVDERAGQFVLPLGATINMDGSALYEAVAAYFIAQAWGIDLSLGQQLILFLTATLSAVGAAGIPEAGLVTMVIVLKAVDLPLEGLGLLIAIDWLLDRFRTAVNVWGDAVGAGVVERLARRFDMRVG